MQNLELPVAFFIFRRPNETSRVFEKIRAARPATLIIVSDGGRPNVRGEIDLVAQTRNVVSEIDWPCVVHRVYSDVNLGLRERLLTGLDEVFSLVDRAIILEDDVLPAPAFFTFCSQMLEVHSRDPLVALVSGFNFSPDSAGDHGFFFSNSTYIWGWATWARVWKEFRSSPQTESWNAAEKTAISSTFSSRIQRRDFLRMMDLAPTLNTWDISLAVWVRQRGYRTIVPTKNYVENIGFGADATHTKFEAFDSQPEVFRSDQFSFRSPVLNEIDHQRERRMWRRKSFTWMKYPLRHPLDFVLRFWRYLKKI